MRAAAFNGPHFICSFKIGFCGEVKQRRRALNREITRGDSGAGEGEARGPNTSANEVLSHKTPLKRHNVIPICNFIIAGQAPLPSPTYTSPLPHPPSSSAEAHAAALLHSALSENTVIKKHLTFF